MKEPTQDQSLVAAIEGDFNGMSKNDLILTCQMLTRGRAIWRKQCEAAEAKLDELAADKERLDWLQHRRCGIDFFIMDDQNGEPTRDQFQVEGMGLQNSRDTVRAAIDSARDGK